jgi:hypothetical protein
MLHEVAKIRRRAVDAVHEQHGHLSGIIWLEEVDAGADVENKIIRSPEALGRMFLTETGIIERGHHTIRRRCAEALLELSARRPSLELHEIDLPFNPRTTFRRDEERLFGVRGTAVTGHQLAGVDGQERFTRLIHAIGIHILESDKPIPTGADAEHPTAWRLQHKVVD